LTLNPESSIFEREKIGNQDHAILSVSQVHSSYRAASLICTALEVEKSNLMIDLIQKSNSEKYELFKKDVNK
jgi:hypothetical protein